MGYFDIENVQMSSTILYRLSRKGAHQILLVEEMKRLGVTLYAI